MSSSINHYVIFKNQDKEMKLICFIVFVVKTSLEW